METKRLITAFLWAFLIGCWIFLFAYQHEGGLTPLGDTTNPVTVEPTKIPKASAPIKPTIPANTPIR